MHKVIRSLARIALAITIPLMGLGVTSNPSGATPGPHKGGTLTGFAGAWTTLDPGNPGWAVGSSTYGYAIYGSLFEPAGKTVTPDLATSYAYSPNGKTLTLQLRRGVRFQDGTPFNASAVKFNLLRDRNTLGLTTTAFYSAIATVAVPNQYEVVLHLSYPDYNLIDIMSDTAAGFMVSPTALSSEGSVTFSLQPVGAGPFKVTADNPSVSLTLSAWNGYWDRKHRYLDELNFLENTNDETTATSLISGAIQIAGFTPTSGPQAVAQALAAPNLKHVSGANLATVFVVTNSFRPPFNNQLAREALDYCTDRVALTKTIMSGVADPAYINAGSSTLYYPGKNPPPGFYDYDVAKGTAIVNQLGGMSFSVIPLAASPQFLAILTALAQEWTACGMKVQISLVSGGQRVQETSSGNYQAFVTLSGGTYNPYYATALYSVPGEADDLYGFSSKTVTDLVSATGYSHQATALDGIWKRIYDIEDQLAVNIPIASGPNIDIYAKNLYGVIPVEAFFDLSHAYFA